MITSSLGFGQRASAEIIDATAFGISTQLGEGYGLHKSRGHTFVLSFVVHALSITPFLMSGRLLAAHRDEIRQQVTGIVTQLSPYIMPPSASKSGRRGGGDRDKLPASRVAVPRLSREELALPAVIVRKENPKLPVGPTVVVPPEIHLAL